MKQRNPILSTNYAFADGEPHLVNGELYVYPSCDESRNYYSSQRYFVPHSRDLENWTIEGVAFEENKVRWKQESKGISSLQGVSSFDDLPEHIKKMLPKESRNVPVEQIIAAINEATAQGVPQKRMLYAPDALTKDGKTYLYFCMSDQSEGVAVADNPAGPFTNAKQIRLDSTDEPIQGIDPAVFMDDDGKCYLYWGQFEAYGAELCDDMVHIKADTMVKGIVTEREHHFHEGSSMRKINGTYYYVFADISRGKATCLGYATADSPLGPFNYQGVIIDNDGCDPGVWNNHGGMECVDGQWYIFYHRSSGNSQYMRRMCAEKIFINADGKIPEVPMTSIGMGEAYRKGERIHAYEACLVHGNAYVEDGVLVVKKGTGTAVYRYAEERNRKQKEISWQGSGTGLVKAIIDGKGQILLKIQATEDMRIESFVL